jgi:hypothetical protein
MADESSSTAGKRFSEDLRHIREERDISVSEIHHETQIAETLIESFEAGRLYDHPTYNRVYLRSFVKAYADAVRIPRERALECLDDALEGTYEDALASTYLTDRSEPDASSEDASSEDAPSGPPTGGGPSRETRDPANTPEAPTAGGPEGRGGIVGPPRAVGDDPPAKAKPNLPDSPVEESPPPTRGDRSDSSSSDRPDTSSPPDDAADDPEAASASSEPSDPVPDEAESTDAPDTSSPRERDGADDPSATDDNPDWMGEETGESSSEPTRPPSSSAGGEEESALGTDESSIVGEPTTLGSGPPGDPPSAAEAGGAHTRSGSGASRTDSNWWTSLTYGRAQLYVTGVGIVAVLLVLVGLGIAYLSSDDTEQPPAATGPPDTTRAAGPADVERAASQRPPADVRLGATIHLTVLATDTVSALRIERDQDLRRPYWIVEGEAQVFPFQERVTIENELPNVRLFVEGYPYPVQPRDTSDGLELTRSGLQSFVDTLRGAPASLSVSPDTIPVGPPTQ